MEDRKDAILRIAAFIACAILVVGMSIAALNPIELVPNARTFYGVKEPVDK